MQNDSYDIVIIGSGAGGGTMAHALAPTGSAHPGHRARRHVRTARAQRTGIRAPSGRICATARRSAGSTTDGASSSRTRTTASAATRSSGAACSTGCGARTSRRRARRTGCRPPGRSTTTTLAPYYDRAEQMYHVHGQAGLDPTEPPRGPFPYRAGSARRGMERIVERLRAQGLHPSPLPLGLIRPGEAGRLRPVRHVQLVSVQDRREERRRDVLLRSPAAASIANVTLCDQRVARRGS